MTTTEALKLLDNAAQAYSGTRKDHVLLQQAIQLVGAELKLSEERRVELADLKAKANLTPIDGGDGDAEPEAPAEGG